MSSPASGRKSRPSLPSPASASRRGSSAVRAGAGSDIPLARRSRPVSAPQANWAVRLRSTLLGGLLVGLLGVGLATGPLRPWLTPAPVAGLNARLSSDGRLLGHLPYPEAPASSLALVAPELQLRPEAAKSFLAMQRAAAANGVDLTVISAFRSIELQRHLFFDVGAERNQSPQSRAKVSAPPGFSEHSTGYAVDVGDGHRPETNLSTSFETSPAFAWLEANAARYHFQLSFPKHNHQGVSYEPWHWRYVGSTEALQQFEPAHRLARQLP